MELIRSLGALAEHPTDETERPCQASRARRPSRTSGILRSVRVEAIPLRFGLSRPTRQARRRCPRSNLRLLARLAIDYPDESDHLTVMLAFYARLRELESDAAGPGGSTTGGTLGSHFCWNIS